MIKIKVSPKTRTVLFDGGGNRLIENGLRKAMNQLGDAIKKEIVDGIKNPPKTGRKYKSLPKRSSTSGEYPADQTGALRRSINTKTISNKKMSIGASADYAKYLEFGIGMGKRKLIEEAVFEVLSKKGEEIIMKAVNSELK